MPWGTFKLAELKLDLQNIRTGLQPDQRASLRAIVEDQKQMLVNLALDLVDVGPSPGEPIWVTADPDDAGQYIVLEGNRRVAALKMLDNPLLANGTSVEADFAAMAKDFLLNPRRELEAQVFVSREDAWPWVERRHMSNETGVALQPWSSLAFARYHADQGASVRRSLLVLNFLNDGTPEFTEVGNIINAKATTVDRVLNAPAMTDALGVHINKKNRTVSFENGDQIAGRRLLRDLIGAMAKSDFKFSKIQGADGRDEFVRSFADRAVKAPDGAAPSPPPGGTVVAFPAKGGVPGRSRLSAPPRLTLAPGGNHSIPKVPGDRLRKLYKECREIKLQGNENAAALLLRVFLELSSETFLFEKTVPLPSKFTSRPTPLTDWGEIGINLHEKIGAVLEVIDTSPRAHQQLQEARVALNKGSDAPGSIRTLHAYFHNADMMPRPVAVREAWDTWDAYLKLLHAARV